MKWLGMNTGLRYKKQQLTKGDKKMKARIFEKNGLPNPLGMIMIILVIGLVCLIQCVLIQPVHAQKMADDVNYIGIETEPEIRIEEWMVNRNLWNTGETTTYLAEESDPEVTIEYWMTDFPIPASTYAQDEPEYKIETWMFDEASWVNSESSNYAVSEKQDECSEDPETGSFK